MHSQCYAKRETKMIYTQKKRFNLLGGEQAFTVLGYISSQK